MQRPPKAKRAAVYVRVSTTNRARRGEVLAFEQNPEVQEMPLRQTVEQRGWTLTQVYSDRMSGAKENRPGLMALMDDARRGAFDVVLVWRFDRFARSVKQLVVALEEFRSLGIDFVSQQEALDTSTPMGRCMFAIVGAMAELERNVHPGAGRVRSGVCAVARHQERPGHRPAPRSVRPRSGGGNFATARDRSGASHPNLVRPPKWTHQS